MAGGVCPELHLPEDVLPEVKILNPKIILDNFPEIFLTFNIFPEHFHPSLNNFPEINIYNLFHY